MRRVSYGPCGPAGRADVMTMRQTTRPAMAIPKRDRPEPLSQHAFALYAERLSDQLHTVEAHTEDLGDRVNMLGIILMIAIAVIAVGTIIGVLVATAI